MRTVSPGVTFANSPECSQCVFLNTCFDQMPKAKSILKELQLAKSSDFSLNYISIMY